MTFEGITFVDSNQSQRRIWSAVSNNRQKTTMTWIKVVRVADVTPRQLAPPPVVKSVHFPPPFADAANSLILAKYPWFPQRRIYDIFYELRINLMLLNRSVPS